MKFCLAHNNFDETWVLVVAVGREIKGVEWAGVTMAEGGEHVIISVLWRFDAIYILDGGNIEMSRIVAFCDKFEWSVKVTVAGLGHILWPTTGLIVWKCGIENRKYFDNMVNAIGRKIEVGFRGTTIVFWIFV